MNLFNVLIVDDEPEIRKGMIMKVDWEQLGLMIEAEASNGQEALAYLEKKSVDIVITDMHMPMMDGVEFLKNCSTYYPKVKLVVITGYDEFLYAKAAIRHKVVDYLLKPVIRAELIETLKKIVDELRNHIQSHADHEQLEWQLSLNRSAMREQLILLTVKETSDYEWIWKEQAKRLRMENWNHQQICFIALDLESSSPEPYRLAFEFICREIVEEWNNESLVFRNPSFPQMMNIIVMQEPDLDKNAIDQLIQKIRDGVQQYLKFKIFIGKGQPITGFNQWKKGYLSALFDWNENKSADPKAQSKHAELELHMSPEIEKQLIYLLKSCKKEAFKDHMEKMLTSAQLHSPQLLVRTIFYIYFLMESTAQDYGITLQSEQQIWLQPDMVWNLSDSQKASSYLFELLESIIDQIDKINASPEGTLFDSVKKFMNDNYANDLHLTMLAERYHFNTSYFSELFRMHVGLTFSDYLTDIRMSKAAQLLLESELPLSDIAELTGYANPSYFSTAFKKRFQMRPSEYRNKRNNEINSE